MRIATVFLLVLSASLPLSVSAQITFDKSDMEGFLAQAVSNDQYIMDAVHYPALGVITGARGGSQTFDFSAYTYSPKTSFPFNVLPSSAGTPGEGDPLFDTANWVQDQNSGGQSWSYYLLNDDGYFFLGNILNTGFDSDMNGSLDQVWTKFSPPDPTYRFPITAGSMWTETYDQVSTVQNQKKQTESTVSFEVGGWGNLITPSGNGEALMLIKTLSIPGLGLVSTTYMFLTNGTFNAGIIIDALGNVLSAWHGSWDSAGGTAVEETPSLSFRLKPNYPNPFSGSTEIGFEMDKPGHARLRVYDMNGREIAVVLQESLPAGSHSSTFHAGDLSAGVYFYELGIDGVSSAQKFMILK